MCDFNNLGDECLKNCQIPQSLETQSATVAQDVRQFIKNLT